MICFPQNMPCVLWHGGKPVPLDFEWIDACIVATAKNASTEDCAWSHDVAAAVRLYFLNDYSYATVTPSELSAILAKTFIALGMENLAVSIRLAPPQTSIYMPELVGRSAFELLFFGLLRERLDAALSVRAGIIRIIGLRESVKMMVGAWRWCSRCEKMKQQIEEFAIRHLRLKTSSPVDIVFA